jgi:Cu-processing system ATP-binding protein
MDLCTRELRVSFGAVQALDGVDAAFGPGQVAVLAGPNGAGKTTLLSVLLGLVKPDVGQVVVDGEQLLSAGRRARHRFRERLGYLPEAVAFSENLSGRQVVRFFARARGVSRERAEEVLSRVGLSGAAGRAVRGYSRGMRQRLGLGVAILAEPELLILDEPTGGLDQEGLGLLWSLFDEWRSAGRTVIVSTHDLALIERRADLVHVLSAGRVKASGSPDVLRRLASLPVRVRLALHSADEAEVVAGLLSQHLGIPVDLGDREVGLSVASADLLGVMKTVEQRRDAILDLRVEEPGLDDVYQRLLELS